VKKEMMMTSPLVMPFILGILFGMCLVNLQETQVVCHQEHLCLEGHTMVGIVPEAMAAAPQHLLFMMMMMMMPLVMPFILGILFGMCLVNLQEIQVVCHQEHPCFKGHTRVGIILETMAVVAEDLLWAMIMTATGDALCLGCPVWDAPSELARDLGSMPLGTSML
jgi:hypothetical protein